VYKILPVGRAYVNAIDPSVTIAAVVDPNSIVDGIMADTPSKTATINTVEWILAWLRNWINSKR